MVLIVMTLYMLLTWPLRRVVLLAKPALNWSVLNFVEKWLPSWKMFGESGVLSLSRYVRGNEAPP